MSDRPSPSVRTRLRAICSGTVVVAVGSVTGLGAAVGGWIAAGQTDSLQTAIVSACVAGLLGSLPVGLLVVAAAAGTVDPVGYHEGVVHVGLTTARPETFTRPVEIAFGVLTTLTLVGVTVTGGALRAAVTRHEPTVANCE